MNEKTIILGMNNPYGKDPKFALYPAPERCAGWNLWKMLADYAQANHGEKVWRNDYADCFDRRNLLTGTDWNQKEARAAAAPALQSFGGRRVIVLGAQPAAALELPRTWAGQWMDYQIQREVPALFSDFASSEIVADRFSYTCLPHPSGRCREYNVDGMKEKAGRLLYEEYKRYDRDA